MQLQAETDSRQESDSARSSSVSAGVRRAASSPIIGPEDLGHTPPTKPCEEETAVVAVEVQQAPTVRIAEQKSPRDLELIAPSVPLLAAQPCAEADPPKYLDFAQDFASFTSNQAGQSPAAYSLKSARETLGVEVSESGMSAPKPQAVSWVALGLLALLTVISSCVLIGLEIGSGMVKWKVAPLRLEVQPVSCEPQAVNDGLMVHIDCPLRKMHTFHAPGDFRANIESFDGLFFEMKVEMFQDTILPGSFKSSVKGTWSDHLLPTQRGWSWDNDKNPDFFPHVEGSGRKFGSSLYGGGFRLERPHVIDFHTKRQLPLNEDSTYIPSSERPPTKVTSRNTRLYENALYTGDPLKPKVGDIRITFFGSSATHLSAVGVQSSPVSAWSRERDLLGFWDPFSKKNATRTIVMEGDYTAKSLLDAFEHENDYCGQHLTIARLVLLTLLSLLFFCVHRLQHSGSSSHHSLLISVIGAFLNAAGLLTVMVGLCAFMYSALISIMWILCGAVLLTLGSICQRSGLKESDYHPLLTKGDDAEAPSPTYITHTVKAGVNGGAVGGTATPSASYAAI